MLRTIWIAVVILSVGLTACSPNKVTIDNYKKLDWTMTREQIHAVLGEPTSAVKPDDAGSGGSTVETWSGKDQDLITITFVNDKLVMKSMRSNGIDY